MAIGATVFKANLQIADMDRHYYAEHQLTLSRHPSETDERMMVRILCFALNAHEHLAFGQGMTDDEEADLWQKDLTSSIERWIDVGMPDERLLRKACGRSDEVLVYCYGGSAAQVWYDQNKKQFNRLKNLSIYNLSPETTQNIAELSARTMKLQCNIQDGEIWLMDADKSIAVELSTLKADQ